MCTLAGFSRAGSRPIHWACAYYNQDMDIQFQNRNIAALRYCPDGEIKAARGFDVVVVHLPFVMEANAEPKGPSWLLDGITLEICTAAPGGGERLLASGSVFLAYSGNITSTSAPLVVPFQCTPKALAEYEKSRKGAPVVLRVRMRARVYELEPGTAHRKALCLPLYVCTQEDIQIDRDKWTAALRTVGLSVSVLIEIPFPIEGSPKDESLTALSDAIQAFYNGGATAWKDCIGHIRPYLEKWKNVERIPETEPKDGSAEDRRWKLLYFRDALHKCCHFWVHESASACNQNDAILALSSFAALLNAIR